MTHLFRNAVILLNVRGGRNFGLKILETGGGFGRNEGCEYSVLIFLIELNLISLNF